MLPNTLADKCNAGNLRRCSACLEWLPRDEAHFRRRPDGRWNSPCRECHKAALTAQNHRRRGPPRNSGHASAAYSGDELARVMGYRP